MRVLLHGNALGRVKDALQTKGLNLDLYVADPDGTIRHNGAPVPEESVQPEIIWASLDTFIGGQFATFFRVAMQQNSVKWLQTFNAGLDMPIFREMVRKRIRLTNSSAQAIAIAEFVMSQVISEWYPIGQYRAAQTAHEWRRVAFRELSQSRWLIIGYGNIGREIAKRAKAFGATIAGVKRSIRAEDFADEVAKLSDVPRLLPSADVVVLACALNDETRDLVNDDFLGRMKSGSILVNIGRGGLVIEDALVKALDKGTPAVAILDVFREEPLPASSSLWDHPKIRISAHTSPVGSGTVARGDRTFLDNLAIYARGGDMINEVDESFF